MKNVHWETVIAVGIIVGLLLVSTITIILKEINHSLGHIDKTLSSYEITVEQYNAK